MIPPVNDASAPPASRPEDRPPAVLTSTQARALALGIADASGQVDAMIAQLGEIVELVRENAAGRGATSTGAPTATGPGTSRRPVRDGAGGLYDGDRRI
jgi:hypothetical protein